MRAAPLLVAVVVLAGCGGTAKPGATNSPATTPLATSTSSATGTPSTPSITLPSATPTTTGSPSTGAPLVTVHGNGFTMGLPHAPTVSHETYATKGGEVNAVLYTDAGAHDAFVAALTAYPAKHQITLDGALTGLARTVSGKVRLVRQLTFHGLPARQARIVGASGGTPVTVFVLVIDVRSKLFQLEYIVSGPELKTAPAILTEVAYSISFT